MKQSITSISDLAPNYEIIGELESEHIRRKIISLTVLNDHDLNACRKQPCAYVRLYLLIIYEYMALSAYLN